DRLAGFRVAANGARQRQQRQSAFETDRVRWHVARQRLGLRLVATGGLAELHVGPEPAAAQANHLAGLRVGPELAPAGVARLGLADVERPRVGARRVLGAVVRAADEAAVAAPLDAKPAGLAVRAGPGVAAVRARREEMWPERGVDRVDHRAAAADRVV